MKEKEEIDEEISNKDFPNQETKYQQVVEEMKQLIPFLQGEMKKCPSSDLVFTLIETVDFYSLKRNFKFKLKSNNQASNDNSLNIFKEKYISNLSTFDSFVTIPISNTNIDNELNNKGQQFKSPKVFDINGDEKLIEINDKEIILFLYANLDELNSFIRKNYNINLICFCLGINMDFFETKKWIKNNGFLNNNNFNFYFTNKTENETNLKYYNLPRIVQIDKDNIITEDKTIKNIQNFYLVEYIMNKNNQNINNKNEESNFIFLENDNKRKIIKAINIYLETAGLNEVHFYVINKISIDKNGIRKIRCNPAFYGETNKTGKIMVDNLVNTLHKQDLFRDVQNKVNFC